MNSVPQKLRKEWSKSPAKQCMRHTEGNCAGRLTKEHVITWQGKQLQEDWAILDICAFHHAVDEFQDAGNLDKEKHLWIALNRAPESRLIELSKATLYIDLKLRLNLKYGPYRGIIINEGVAY